MRKILFLGGSAQQVPAILAAKEMGLYTIVIDYLPDNPGKDVADNWYPDSTTDIEAVCRIAKEEKVDGILPYASDPAALPAAMVAERLGLPTNPAKSVEILGVKHKFRSFLQQQGFASPSTYVFPISASISDVKDGLSRLTFPIVVKPTDSSGSKGVTFLEEISQLEHAISHASEYSRNHLLIAEEYITRGFPYVIGGDIFVENGQIVLFGAMACMRDEESNGLIPVGKFKPDGLDPNLSQILRQELQRLIDALEIRIGEFNIEALIDKEGQPHFLEVGPRAGGNMIPIQLSDAYGVDLIKANVAAAMGLPVDLHPIEPVDSYMTYVLHSNVDGIYAGIDYSEEITPYVYRKVHYKKEGDKVQQFDGAGKALGIVFMRFPNNDLMHKFRENIGSHIKIRFQ